MLTVNEAVREIKLNEGIQMFGLTFRRNRKIANSED
jgi:hypothetical protein